MKQIRFASDKDGDKIGALRLTEFQRSSDFKLVNSSFLEWGELDKKCKVVCIFNEKNQAISTILLNSVENNNEAVDAIGYNLPTKIPFPALVFSRAATRLSYRRKGLNQLLRYYSIKAAVNSNINSLISPVFKHATRTDFMKEMGYQFYTPDETSIENLIPSNIRQLAVLDRSKMEYAIKIIERRIYDLIKEFPWQGQSITL